MTKRRVENKPSEKLELFIRVAVCLFIAGLCYVTLKPSNENDFVNWDDPAYVLGNPHFKDFKVGELFKLSNFDVGNYHPFTIMSLYYDYKKALKDAENPHSYKAKHFHKHNLVLHVISVMLIFFIALLLLGNRIVPASIVALLFGVHPMHVESVAWISERKDVLHAMYYFAAWLAYILYVKKGKAGWLYIVSIVLFLFSLLSKGQAVTLSMVIILTDLFLNRKIDRKLIIEKIPFFILSIGFGILAIYAQETGGGTGQVDISKMDSIYVGFYGFVIYSFKFFIPHNLACLHPYPPMEDGGLPSIFIIYPIIFLCVIGIGYYAYKKDRNWIFGPLVFLLTILPVLQFFPVGQQIIAERYTYIPYVGLSFLIGYIVYKLELSKMKFIYGVYIILVLAIWAFGAKAREQTKVWKDTEKLWSQVMKLYPDEPTAYVNRGYWYNQVNRYSEGVADADIGLAVDSSNFKLWENRGVANQRMGKFSEAINDYSMSIQYNDTNLGAIINRGIIFTDNLQQYEKGIKDFTRVLELDSMHFNAASNMGIAYFKSKQYSKAIDVFLLAQRIDPSSGRTFWLKALCFAGLGDYSRAINNASKAQQLGTAIDSKVIDRWRSAIK